LLELESDGDKVGAMDDVGTTKHGSVPAVKDVLLKKWPTLKKLPNWECKKNLKFYNNDFQVFATELQRLGCWCSEDAWQL